MAEEATVETGETQETEAQGQAGSEQQGQQETQQQASQQQQQSGEQESQKEDWREGITDPKLKEFANRFTSPADAAKAALDMRQKLSNAIVPPGKDASEEDVKAFNKRLGVPDDPSGYEVNLPEGLDAENLDIDLDEFKSKLHELGARPNTAKGLADWYFGKLSEQMQAAKKAAEDSYAKSEEALKKEWGGDYDTNLEEAKRAARQFGDDEFNDMLNRATLDGKPVGNHPAFLRAMAKVGRRMGEGGLAMGEEEKQSASQKMDELTQEAHDAMAKGDRKKADRLFQERDALAQKVYS